MIWKERVVHWGSISAIVATGITLVLVTILLLPSILDGPDSSFILSRANCKINNVTYITNYCERDTSQDFSNLVYREFWETCKLVEFSVETDLVINNNLLNCTWKYPLRFRTEDDAFLAILSDNYGVGLEYKCVADTYNHICYPDKRETLIFGLSVGGMFLLLILSISTYYYGKKWIRRKKQEMEQLSRMA